jgi:hypothetical protein
VVTRLLFAAQYFHSIGSMGPGASCYKGRLTDFCRGRAS